MTNNVNLDDDEYVKQFVLKYIWRLPPGDLQCITEMLDPERASIISEVLRNESLKMGKEIERLTKMVEDAKKNSEGGYNDSTTS